jgi:hypothetical protein
MYQAVQYRVSEPFPADVLLCLELKRHVSLDLIENLHVRIGLRVKLHVHVFSGDLIFVSGYVVSWTINETLIKQTFFIPCRGIVVQKKLSICF